MCYTAWVPDGEAAQYWTKQGGKEHSNKQDKVDLSQTLKIQHYQKQSSEEETGKPAKITNVANTKSDVLFNNDLRVLSGCLHVITGNSLDSAADFGPYPKKN